MIDKTKFLEWAKKRLGTHIEAGHEIRFNSIWKEDSNHHLYCNLSGGKSKIKFGVYQCWKSNHRGTLVSLVREVESCSFLDALEILGLSERVRPKEHIDFYDDEEVSNILPQDTFKVLEFPEGCLSYDSCDNYQKNLIKNYLSARSIPPEYFYLGTKDKYKNRILIPYYDQNRNLIYYNGRAIYQTNLRYLGPSKEIGVGKSDVVFIQNWFTNGEKVYLCEGEFDAVSLNISGFCGCAVGGKFVSIIQATILSNRKICLAFDNDEAGKSSIEACRKILEKFGCTVSKVCPPESIKDWNEFLVKHGQAVLKAYINKTEEETW